VHDRPGGALHKLQPIVPIAPQMARGVMLYPQKLKVSSALPFRISTVLFSMDPTKKSKKSRVYSRSINLMSSASRRLTYTFASWATKASGLNGRKNSKAFHTPLPTHIPTATTDDSLGAPPYSCLLTQHTDPWSMGMTPRVLVDGRGHESEDDEAYTPASSRHTVLQNHRHLPTTR